jgi:hypothetical protein
METFFVQICQALFSKTQLQRRRNGKRKEKENIGPN